MFLFEARIFLSKLPWPNLENTQIIVQFKIFLNSRRTMNVFSSKNSAPFSTFFRQNEEPFSTFFRQNGEQNTYRSQKLFSIFKHVLQIMSGVLQLYKKMYDVSGVASFSVRKIVCMELKVKTSNTSGSMPHIPFKLSPCFWKYIKNHWDDLDSIGQSNDIFHNFFISGFF